MARAALALGGAIWAAQLLALLGRYLSPQPVVWDLTILAALALPVAGVGAGAMLLSRNQANAFRIAAAGVLIGLSIAGSFAVLAGAFGFQLERNAPRALFSDAVGVAVVGASAALWLGLCRPQRWARVAGAIVLALAICGISFIVQDQIAVDAALAPDPGLLLIMIAAISLAFASLAWVRPTLADAEPAKKLEPEQEQHADWMLANDNLHLFHGLLRMQLQQFDDEKDHETLRENMRRFDVIAIGFDRLRHVAMQRRIELRSYFEVSCERLSRLYSRDDIAISVGPGTMWLEPREAILTALIVSEVVAGAFKHAFPDRRGGHIAVTLSHASDLTITVADDGVGISEATLHRENRNFGLRAVEALSGALNGTFAYQRQGGTIFRLVLPGTEQRQCA